MAPPGVRAEQKSEVLRVARSARLPKAQRSCGAVSPSRAANADGQRGSVAVNRTTPPLAGGFRALCLRTLVMPSNRRRSHSVTA